MSITISGYGKDDVIESANIYCLENNFNIWNDIYHKFNIWEWKRVYYIDLYKPNRKTFKDIPTPIGSFIMDNADGVEGTDGQYYHYSDVCRLIKKYHNEKK